MARAHSALAAPEEAMRCWARAIEERRGDASAQRELTRSWLDWALALDDADSDEGLVRELEARAQMRGAWGDELPAEDFARELDLLTARARHEDIVELVTAPLTRHPRRCGTASALAGCASGRRE